LNSSPELNVVYKYEGHAGYLKRPHFSTSSNQELAVHSTQPAGQMCTILIKSEPQVEQNLELLHYAVML
jgi:hypothetical protein